MSKKEIMDIINNGGATLNTDLKSAELNNGYMVSMENHETMIKLGEYDTLDKIEAILSDYQKASKKIKAFIGLWVNDNTLYIDLSKNYKRKANAIKIGLKNKQLGIFDLGNLQTIML